MKREMILLFFMVLFGLVTLAGEDSVASRLFMWGRIQHRIQLPEVKLQVPQKVSTCTKWTDLLET